MDPRGRRRACSLSAEMELPKHSESQNDAPHAGRKSLPSAGSDRGMTGRGEVRLCFKSSPEPNGQKLFDGNVALASQAETAFFVAPPFESNSSRILRISEYRYRRVYGAPSAEVHCRS